jgi:hypothetical protein
MIAHTKVLDNFTSVSWFSEYKKKPLSNSLVSVQIFVLHHQFSADFVPPDPCTAT